jgi:hypothetical protein
MELLIGLLVLAVAGYIAYKHFTKEEPVTTESKDSAPVVLPTETVPVPAKVEESKVFVDGHGDVRETVPVASEAKPQAPKKSKAPRKPAAAKPAGSSKPRAPKKPKMTVAK